MTATIIKPGSPEWHKWREEQNRQHGNGIHHHNRPAIDPHHPHAPKSHPHPKGYKHHKPHPSDHIEAHIVYYANLGLNFAGKMIYSELSDREMLFARKPGDYLNAHADCSQYGATDLKWCGNKLVVNTDYTGTLLEKCIIALHPAHGLGAVWGPGTGAHFAWLTEHIKGGNDWYVVGFGHPGAPDRNTLSGMNEYFDSIGEPGVRYLQFSK